MLNHTWSSDGALRTLLVAARDRPADLGVRLEVAARLEDFGDDVAGDYARLIRLQIGHRDRVRREEEKLLQRRLPLLVGLLEGCVGEFCRFGRTLQVADAGNRLGLGFEARFRYGFVVGRAVRPDEVHDAAVRRIALACPFGYLTLPWGGGDEAELNEEADRVRGFPPRPAGLPVCRTHLVVTYTEAYPVVGIPFGDPTRASNPPGPG